MTDDLRTRREARDFITETAAIIRNYDSDVIAPEKLAHSILANCESELVQIGYDQCQDEHPHVLDADPEAVTRALAEHRLVGGSIWDLICSCGDTGDYYAHLASVLASLPDDRLAEAEAKVARVEALADQADADAGYVFDGAHNYGAKVETPRIRAALSGGDVPPKRDDLSDGARPWR